MLGPVSPQEAAALLEARRHARHPARDRAAARLPGRARRARRLDGPPHLRRAAARLVGGVHAPERPLPVGLLRPGRAVPARPGRQHQLRPRRLPPLRAAARAQPPRVMATVAAPPDADGWCSLSLHAGGTLGELQRAGADPDAPARRRGVAAVPAHVRPRRRSTRTRCTSTRSTSSSRPTPSRSPSPTPRRPTIDAAIAEHAAPLHPRRRDAADRHRRDPVDDRRPARRGRRRRLRHALGDVHHRAHAAARGRQGHATARASSTASRSPRSPPAPRELYDWLDGNDEVRFLPVDVVNSPDLIAPQPAHGHDQRRARRRPPGPGRRRHDRRRASSRASAATRTSSPARRSRSRTASLLCLPSTVSVGGELRLADRAVVRRAAR